MRTLCRKKKAAATARYVANELCRSSAIAAVKMTSASATSGCGMASASAIARTAAMAIPINGWRGQAIDRFVATDANR